jgi:arsenite oxidase small subunit
LQRRQFLEGCAAASLGAWQEAWAQSPARAYPRSRLVDIHGRPVRLAALEREVNYVFQYPFEATPCLLVKLRAPVAVQPMLKRADGTAYEWKGGVGRDRNAVAFSAICAHKLAYPTREVSFIRYQRDASATSSGRVIHCCADHSVYDPTAGARVVAGPAPQPLASIALEYDAVRDELAAVGTAGAEQFEPFFEKYAFKLELEYGGLDRARKPVENTTVVRELTNYCRTTIEC